VLKDSNLGAGSTKLFRASGASIWNTPALDPELGLVYFAVGNCGPDYDGSMREGDNLFCASVLAVDAKTGKYAWHFQEVHHDIWDYDAASPPTWRPACPSLVRQSCCPV
jgi:alcohol dehydrogenase (cytochrome c)